jgi:Zn-dependent peptidase ImmA (M78 family)
MLSVNQIEKRADAVLDAAGIKGPSINVEDVARALGITVREESTTADVSGALFRRDGRVVIGVNPHHVPNRRRFTIAHEIGHFVLHRDDLHMDDTRAYSSEPGITHRLLRDQVSSMATDPKEIEANRFAAALLMPVWMLKESLDSYESPLKQEDIERLAGKYEVSFQAMAFRLSNLGVPIDVSM